MPMKDTRRLYTDLAWLWPLWGEVDVDYAHYCDRVRALMDQHASAPVKTVLDIGCGGGKNVHNLERAYKVTGLDISAAMLAQARTLNPECEFIEADMRDFSLNRNFDAVLMDDAISYMSSLADFEAAFRCAYAHLKPGGVLITTPDVTIESFEQNRTQTTTARRDDLEVVFIENIFDPDPGDESFETTVVYLIRQHGQLSIETDHWTMGLFSMDTWRSVLTRIGFTVFETPYALGEDAYTVLACVKTRFRPVSLHRGGCRRAVSRFVRRTMDSR